MPGERQRSRARRRALGFGVALFIVGTMIMVVANLVRGEPLFPPADFSRMLLASVAGALGYHAGFRTALNG